MNIRKSLFFTLCPLFFCACNETQVRMSEIEISLMEVEEKVDALLTYSNTTHDAITDIDLRMEALEQDAKKRGVPVRIKGVDIAAAKAELDRIDGRHAPVPFNTSIPNLSDTGVSQSTLPVESSNASQNALKSLAQDEQNLLLQNPTLAALHSNTQSAPSALPEQDMTVPTSNANSNSQKLSDGYSMAEGITIKLPDSENTFEYPEHTQTIEAVQGEIDNQVSTLANQNIGPITGQNLQVPLLTQAENTPHAPVPTSPYTIDTIPEPVSLTPKPATTSTSNSAKAPVTTAPATTASSTDSLAQNTQSTQQSKPSSSPSPSSATYDGAMALYKSRQYAESEKAFDAFLQANPNSPLAPNALYWKGETYYARALYPQAIFAFKEVQTRYPKHSKAPDSLLKTAMSYERLGDTENANLHYLVLVEDFPASAAAKRVPK